jgi:hypothetical protein
MDARHAPQEIRQVVLDAFAHLGVDAAQLEDMRETVIVRDGTYYGRSYRAGEFFAMWMISVKLLQFYGPEGEMLGTVNLGREAAASANLQAA